MIHVFNTEAMAIAIHRVLCEDMGIPTVAWDNIPPDAKDYCMHAATRTIAHYAAAHEEVASRILSESAGWGTR